MAAMKDIMDENDTKIALDFDFKLLARLGGILLNRDLACLKSLHKIQSLRLISYCLLFALGC